MKSFVKALVLAPAMLVALTACQSKLSDEKAKERADGYKPAEVAEKYESVDVKSDVDVKKRTGVFAEDGLLAALVNTAIEAATRDDKGLEPSAGIFVMSDAEQTDGVTLEYYSYKKTGLKIVVKTDMDQKESGANIKITGTGNTYVLDDGRYEKGDSKVKMFVDANVGGVAFQGECEYTTKTVYTWHAAQ